MKEICHDSHVLHAEVELFGRVKPYLSEPLRIQNRPIWLYEQNSNYNVKELFLSI